MKSMICKQVLRSNRFFCTNGVRSRRNAPLSGNEMPRSGGIASMMRLPVQENTDGAVPFEDVQVADVGDVSMNIYNLPEAVKQIKAAYDKLISNGCVPLTMGGDHTITYPILQAMKDKHGPVGLILLDAHPDTQDTMLGASIAHGTPFRRAVEYGCLDCTRVVQIGLNGSVNSLDDYKWGLDQGFRVVTAKECWHKSLEPLMAEVRGMMGQGPVYISFDIDALDPSYAPGTGVLTNRAIGL